MSQSRRVSSESLAGSFPPTWLIAPPPIHHLRRD